MVCNMVLRLVIQSTRALRKVIPLTDCLCILALVATFGFSTPSNANEASRSPKSDWISAPAKTEYQISRDWNLGLGQTSQIRVSQASLYRHDGKLEFRGGCEIRLDKCSLTGFAGTAGEIRIHADKVQAAIFAVGSLGDDGTAMLTVSGANGKVAEVYLSRLNLSAPGISLNSDAAKISNTLKITDFGCVVLQNQYGTFVVPTPGFLTSLSVSAPEFTPEGITLHFSGEANI